MNTLSDLRFSRVLVVVAHMDDEALFCGGTLRRLRDQGCEVSVAVSACVEDTNAGPSDTRERQQRRLVAFGRSCGMLDVERVFLLDAPNAKRNMMDARAAEIGEVIRERLAPVLAEFAPAAVITHGPNGEYGHAQHMTVSRVVQAAWNGPLWTFSATGPERIPIDLGFKKRLVGCYRHGTTQEPYWTPYALLRESSTGPWLGDIEGFCKRS